MSQTVEVETRSRADLVLWLLPILLLLSHWAIALKYIPRMWNFGQYQFFPLVFLVVGWLFWKRRGEIVEAATEPSPRVLKVWLMFGFVAVVFATLAGSSSLGMVSLISAVATVVYWCAGRSGLRASIPMLFLLCFVIPVPFGMDQKLIIRMQFLASQLASWLLDSVGEIHFRQGVILVTEKNRFLTEEACSGIRSLFSSITAMAIYGVVNRYPWWRHLVNQVQVLFWVIAGNAIRVATVVFVTDHFTDKLATGIGHEILGLAVFLFIFAMAISTDCLISLLLRTEFYIWLDHGADNVHSDDAPVAIKPIGVLSRMATTAFIVLFVGANLVGAKVAYARFSSQRDYWSNWANRLPVPDAADMPQKIGTWEKTHYEHVNRGKDQIQAEDSYIWAYSDVDLTALVSIDCPWSEWHDLTGCYLALGWDTKTAYLLPSQAVSGDVEEREWSHSEIRMHRDNMKGFVVFSSVDRNRQPVEPPSTYTSSTAAQLIQRVTHEFTNSVTQTFGDHSKIRVLAPPASTIQLYCAHGSEFSSEQIDRLRKLFVEARQLILASPRYEKK